MKTVYPSTLLKLAMAADAVVSGAVAALQLAASGLLAQLLLLPQALLVETGAFLVAYTVLLAILAGSERVWSALIGMIVAGNLAWAVGCVALLASGSLSPSALGVAFVMVQAIAVLIFAAIEFKGLRASATAPGTSAARA